MNTDLQGFKDAFFKVVHKRDYNIAYNHLLTYAIGEDCWGSVYTKTFNIQKRRAQSSSVRLEGNIIEDENGLLLELYLRTGYNTIRMGIKAFAFSVLLAYCIGYLPFISPWLEDYFLVWAIILAILIFPLVFKLARWITNAAVNGLQRDFMLVLKEIEKHLPISG